LKEEKGLWSVPGVKLTRAELPVKKSPAKPGALARDRAAASKLVTLHGGEFSDFSSYVQQARTRLIVYSDDELKYLIGRYGTLYSEVLRWADRIKVIETRFCQTNFGYTRKRLRRSS